MSDLTASVFMINAELQHVMSHLKGLNAVHA